MWESVEPLNCCNYRLRIGRLLALFPAQAGFRLIHSVTCRYRETESAMISKEDSKKEKADGEVVRLQRKIGLVPAVSFIIGTVVGSGIFIAPKGVLMNSGSVGLSLLVWALCGVLSLFGALCYAELGTSFTKSGGHYTYLLETLGPLPAFLRLWVEFLFIRPAVSSYVSLAFGRYVVEPFFAPCPAPMALIRLVSFLGLTFVVAVNCWSVSMASRTQVTLTFIKMFALVLIIIPGCVALGKGKTENFQNGFEVDLLTLDRLPLAFFNGLYAYGGWFYLNFVTEEVINPNRNIPLAIICSMVTVTVFYVLVNVAYYTMMTPAELLLSDAVAVTFANRTLQGMASVIPILVALSCLGALNGGFFAVPRMLFVGARDGHWPPIFSMIHIRRHTPLPAVLFLVKCLPHIRSQRSKRKNRKHSEEFTARRNIPAHQLCLFSSLVLHRLGDPWDAHPSISFPSSPETFQSVLGHRDHLHLGLLLHRGPVSLFRPLEHWDKLCSHTDWGPGLLCDGQSFSLAS
ncbi:cystine/glutamate transporter isoform X2 [Amphiprion ocellaris]|uniref:cystine/glutamate transporter isoform X2 n=1 Tax=Amphiprion ocellaris TaxID=80972 RepID=UPI002410E30B|nr:cystine/glutamate transporter isoform X2 [Amphiprion ocellaris]